MTAIGLHLIPGFMVGFEWQYDYRLLILDFLIIRITIHYGLTEEDLED